MSNSPLMIRKAAVLGAGVMGAQIAAHLVNCGVPVVLFDLPAREGDPDGIVRKALAVLARLEPAPFATRELAASVDVANYGRDLAKLAECDLVVEAIAERLDWKRDLYAKVAGHLAPHAVLATNTSGLSLAALSGVLPPALRRRFCGVHFFNPPRYMHLVEVIAGPETEAALLDRLEAFLVTTLGKGVVRAKDTPNFVANRIGVFSIVATLLHTERFGLPYDVVDALTGPAIGRPKSASYRTVDVVGLDTTAHVIGTMRDTLAGDPWHRHFEVPGVLAALIARGALGQKTGAGFYRKQGKTIEVLEPASATYRPAAADVAPEVAEILKVRAPGEKLGKLRACPHPQAQFLWAVFRDVFHYAAHHLAHIADNARDVDLALRWGFGWKQGPFETWQAAGWSQVASWIAEDVVAGRALANVPLPAWVQGERVRAAGGVHTAKGSYAPAADAFHGRPTLPVYERQLRPDLVLGERLDGGTVVFETEAVRLWHLGDDVAVLSFRTKKHTVSEGVLDGVLRACDEVERSFAGLVVWQPEEPFSLGADLSGIGTAAAAGQWSGIEAVVAKFQQASLRLRSCLVPTVAAVRGMALGGSCEFILHCDRTVAALESYIGLVEAGVGLLPGGGGCKELTLRAHLESRRGAAGSQIDMLPVLRTYFQQVATAAVSKSAFEAKDLGYLRPADTVVANGWEVLHVAKAQARSLAEAGYRPPLPARNIAVAGRTGIATLQMLLVNMRDGGFISAYDYEIGLAIARVMCGGEVDAGSLVDEGWLIELERAEFMRLLRHEKTQARIAHTLATGKPLRN